MNTAAALRCRNSDRPLTRSIGTLPPVAPSANLRSAFAIIRLAGGSFALSLPFLNEYLFQLSPLLRESRNISRFPVCAFQRVYGPHGIGFFREL